MSSSDGIGRKFTIQLGALAGKMLDHLSRSIRVPRTSYTGVFQSLLHTSSINPQICGYARGHFVVLNNEFKYNGLKALFVPLVLVAN
jgi:hypothetical protein